MASLEEKIVHLKAEIVVYEKELAEATTPEEKKDLRQLITSTSEYLSRLLDRQREQARGNVFYFDGDFHSVPSVGHCCRH
jgi:hypothetical protein